MMLRGISAAHVVTYGFCSHSSFGLACKLDLCVFLTCTLLEYF